MQKVVGVNLNGHAYQVEERGYESLLAYLDRAHERLANNPDRKEIVADLEQAIAEKCNNVLGPHKTVVTAVEVERILAEMGPVDSGEGDAESPASAENGKTEHASGAAPPKRLYQIREGAMISGVCNGIAAYAGIDVTIVRIAFVILAVLTKGVGLLVYGVLMFVIPYAETSEEHAAAHGRPFTAQELIDQARRNYTDLKTKDWKRQWRRQRREWQRQWRYGIRQPLWDLRERVRYGWHPWSGAAVFGLVHAALVLTLIFALLSLTKTGAVFGLPLPEGLPLWAGFLIVIVIYQVIAAPLIFARRAALFAYAPTPFIWIAPGFGIIWLGIVVLSIWYGYHHVPEVREFIQNLPAAWAAFVDKLRS